MPVVNQVPGFGAQRLSKLSGWRDEMWRTNQYIYAANGVDLVAQIGPDGRTNQAMVYNANHQVLFVTNAANDVAAFTYDSQGRPTSLRSFGSLTTTNVYFSSGPLTNWVERSICYRVFSERTFGQIGMARKLADCPRSDRES